MRGQGYAWWNGENNNFYEILLYNILNGFGIRKNNSKHKKNIV